MSNPVIDYGYGFVPCEPNDPKRTGYLHRGTWFYLNAAMTFKPELPNRKPVEIPDGWELVPERELDLIPQDYEWQFITNSGARGKLANASKCTARSWINSLDVAAFIRRKPVQPTVEPSKPAVDWSKPIRQEGASNPVRFFGEIDRSGGEIAIACRSAGGGDEFIYFVDRNGVSHTNPASNIINVPERIKKEIWYVEWDDHTWSAYDSDSVKKHIARRLASGTAKPIAAVPLTIDCEKGAGL